MANTNESWTRSDDNFFNNSFHNKDYINPEDLGHGLDPTSRAELRQRHQEILDTADVEDGFIPLARDLVSRPRTLRLPEGIDHRFPLDFFMLFFTMNMFITIRDNTNAYAALFYIANTSNSHRVWVDVTIEDIRMFLAIVIYIVLHGNLKIQDFWKKPIYHEPMSRMSFYRYKQIKRFFKVSNPATGPESPFEKRTLWYMKLSPLFETVCILSCFC
jgi:hypothetical protein